MMAVLASECESEPSFIKLWSNTSQQYTNQFCALVQGFQGPASSWATPPDVRLRASGRPPALSYRLYAWGLIAKNPQKKS
jgi:hypothetical protein